MLVRDEQVGDRDAVYVVNASAFETPAEARLVDALRAQAQPVVSLVGEDGGEVVGHIMFSPVTLSGDPQVLVMGLAPMAVAPERQNEGIGSALVREGLLRCEQLGFAAAVVLGHPEYYPRFGFSPSSRFGIDSEYDVPDEVFMAMELQPGALNGKRGRIKYHAAFSAVQRGRADVANQGSAVRWRSPFHRPPDGKPLRVLSGCVNAGCRAVAPFSSAREGDDGELGREDCFGAGADGVGLMPRGDDDGAERCGVHFSGAADREVGDAPGDRDTVV